MDAAYQTMNDPWFEWADYWRRAHRECAPPAPTVDGGSPARNRLRADRQHRVTILKQAVGVTVAEAAALDVFERYGDVLTAFRVAPIDGIVGALDVNAGRRFQHIERARRAYGWIDADLRDEIREYARSSDTAADGPARCAAGACAFCGRAEAVGWVESPFTWSDGTPAALCGSCNRVWERRGSPTLARDTATRYDDVAANDLRAVAVELLTGYAVLGMSGYGLKLFHEIAEADEKGGFPEPWAFRPDALDEVRADVWRVQRHLIPAGAEGDRFRERFAAEDAEEVARAAENAQQHSSGWERSAAQSG
ncbi:hypothetical protein GE115_00115 [Agromyces sp. CFH 90414]|uniref:Uncharacterized protein n=1 Tax=Agromyces agglutinans TaxID=2662258 RepID=A0A6I2EYT5_9MICO|nr:hypothetical protein [Agromyces agglutinans]MRG58285.1 hypothetical protein [Agromyces agglutinans]